MPQNDIIALENNFESWKAKRFPFDLGDSQLQSGMVGGSGDGGVDAFYVFANGELIDSETELDPKELPEFKMLIIQSKSDEGFSPIEIDKLYFFVEDLLDLGRKKTSYHTTYRADLIALMRIFKDKFGFLVGETPALSIEFVYIVKKDVSPTVDAVTSGQKVCNRCLDFFSHAKPEFRFVNASALWKQIQARPPRKKALRWASQPMSTQQGEIGLVTLRDYYNFVKDGDKKIAERFFDSNVRGYWKTSPINKKIAETLKNPDSPEFWLLNNGITILSEKLETGPGFLEIDVHDPQIVNGLQTSRQIFQHFQGGDASGQDDRRVLVRIVKSGDKTLRDEVIRCTNSQNVMPEEALRATDKIHRQLETAFLAKGLYYDRRKGHYRDEGKPIAQIVSVIDALQAMVAIVLQRPNDARGRPKDYIKKDEKYNEVFGEDKYSLTLYLKTYEICQRVSKYLDSLGLESIHRRNIYFYLCTYIACVMTSNGHANPGKIEKINVPSITDAILEDAYKKVRKLYEGLAVKQKSEDGEKDYDSVAKGPNLLKSVLNELIRKYNPKKAKP
jgi:hypothetical protein